MNNLDELLIMLIYITGWLSILAAGAFLADYVLPKIEKWLNN